MNLKDKENIKFLFQIFRLFSVIVLEILIMVWIFKKLF